MNSRLFRLLVETRKQNVELLEKIDSLERQLAIESKLLNGVLESYGSLYEQYEHEKKNNDVLVKHSHILFEKLSSMQKIKMVLPNVKEVVVDPSKVAHKPTYEELEDIFKGDIARGKKN